MRIANTPSSRDVLGCITPRTERFLDPRNIMGLGLSPDLLAFCLLGFSSQSTFQNSTLPVWSAAIVNIIAPLPRGGPSLRLIYYVNNPSCTSHIEIQVEEKDFASSIEKQRGQLGVWQGKAGGLSYQTY